MNQYSEAKKRIWDEKLWFWLENPNKRVEYSYKESPNSCKTPKVGVVTYPCCAFCGIRTGEDNTEFHQGGFCDRICSIAWDIKIRKVDYTDVELIRDQELQQLLLPL